MDITTVLQRHQLKDTKPRRSILELLDSATQPLSTKDIYQLLKQKRTPVNLVTIYRVIQAFVDLHIVHQHPSSGSYSLCSQSDKNGHHVLLSCKECGKIDECIDAELCKQENRIAKNAGFTPKQHISEIVGVCSTCS